MTTQNLTHILTFLAAQPAYTPWIETSSNKRGNIWWGRKTPDRNTAMKRAYLLWNASLIDASPISDVHEVRSSRTPLCFGILRSLEDIPLLFM